IEIEMAESKAEDDYEPNLVGFAENGDCDFILAVGGLMGDALKIVAEEFPDQRFGIVDANVPLDNVFSMEFDTAQSSFLAGYLAAGMSKTGVVATYGGLEIPPVTIFMDGYAQGIEYYNEEEDADVKLLGWDYEKQNGSFTGNFDSSDDGQSQTETFVSQDADVIFPVAGGTGVGTPTVTQDHDDVYSIWVDVDGAVSVPNYKDQFLSTSVKNMPDAVRDAVVNARDDGPMDGRTVGTLENEGVSLAPLHEDVPDELASKLTEIQQMIIDGDIPVVSEAQPDPVE
ncbi:MAG: BMP family lipoprotein, partial [Stackebrandtia sp.]